MNGDATTRRLPPVVPAVAVLVVAVVAALVVWLAARSGDSPEAGRSTSTTASARPTSPDEASRPYGKPGAGAKSDPKAAAAARNPPGSSAAPATAPTTAAPLDETTLHGSGPASIGPFAYEGSVRISLDSTCPGSVIIGTGADRRTVASGEPQDVTLNGPTPMVVADNCPWTLGLRPLQSAA